MNIEPNLMAAITAPLFLIFSLGEYLFSKYKKRDVFKYESTISNISIGIAERFTNLFVSLLFFNLFVWVYDNYAILSISDSWYIALPLLLVADFVWYWYHRLGHQINIFWAAHIVHHHSEEFNFSAASRITIIQAFIRTPFWCVLPLLGFHPKQVITVLVFHGMYSFFTHTQMIKAPKWLEKIFITPSLHGIHHASNVKYLDKNFGDVFVFWDKLFGTFQKENEKPVYGITHPLHRHSFLWQHFHYYFEILEGIKEAKKIKEKLKIVFGSPNIMKEEYREKAEETFFNNLPKCNLNPNLKNYINAQVVLVFVILSIISYQFEKCNAIEIGCYTGILFITLINIGALLEQRKWIYYLEIIRISLLALFFCTTFHYWELDFVVILGILTLTIKKSYKEWYFEEFLQYKN